MFVVEEVAPVILLHYGCYGCSVLYKFLVVILLHKMLSQYCCRKCYVLYY